MINRFEDHRLLPSAPRCTRFAAAERAATTDTIPNASGLAPRPFVAPVIPSPGLPRLEFCPWISLS
jgi:hypothetical protein